MEQQKKLVTCTVNGHEVAEYVDVRESLLEMLRNRLGLTSVKKGCEVVNAVPVRSLWMERPSIPVFIWPCGPRENRSALWKTSWDNWKRTRIQEAFIEEGAIQCGF